MRTSSYYAVNTIICQWCKVFQTQLTQKFNGAKPVFDVYLKYVFHWGRFNPTMQLLISDRNSATKYCSLVFIRLSCSLKYTQWQGPNQLIISDNGQNVFNYTMPARTELWAAWRYFAKVLWTYCCVTKTLRMETCVLSICNMHVL